MHSIDIPLGPRIGIWGESDYRESLEILAESLEMDIGTCARRFGTLDFQPRALNKDGSIIRHWDLAVIKKGKNAGLNFVTIGKSNA